MKKKIRVRSYKGCSEKERIKFLTEARNVLLVNDHYTRVDTKEVLEGDNISVGYISKISGNIDLRRTEIDASQNYIILKRSYIHHINGGNEEYITILQFAGNGKCEFDDLIQKLNIPRGSDIEFLYRDSSPFEQLLDTGVKITNEIIGTYKNYIALKRTITSPIGLEVVSEKYIILINKQE